MGFKVPEIASKYYGQYVAQMPSCEGMVYAITGTSTGALHIRGHSVYVVLGVISDSLASIQTAMRVPTILVARLSSVLFPLDRGLAPAPTNRRKGVQSISGTLARKHAGLGAIAAKCLVLKGAHVLALNRPSDRATASSNNIRAEIPKAGGGQLTDVTCDLQSFESVRSAGAQVLEVLEGTGLDALVCNAGAVPLDHRLSFSCELRKRSNSYRV